MGRLCFQSDSDASPLSFPQGTETIFFVCGGEWVAFFFFPLEPRICETGPGSLSGATPENPRERRRGAGEDSAGGRFGVPPQIQPRPHLRGGGTLRRWTNQHLPALTWPPPPSGSREPRFSKGRAELSGALTRSRGSFSSHSLQPWGSLVGLSCPSSSASSSYSRYSIALPDPCRDVPQRAGGVRTRRWRRGESRTGLPGAKVVRESL